MRLTEFVRGGRFRDKLESFFMGIWYPVTTALLVLLEHLFGIEVYLGSLNVLLASLSLIVCSSTLPIFTFVSTFVFQISLKNSPAIPNESDYLVTGARPFLIFVLGAIFVGAIAYFCIKRRIFSKITFSTPMLLPLLVLSLGFSLNGAFSSEWSVANLAFGLCEAVCYFALFMLLYLGICEDNTDLIISRFIFSSAMVASVMIAEVIACYVTRYDGTKESMLFGWGVWNTAGISLAMLIPVFFLGFYRLTERKNKLGTIYLALAVLTYVAAALTQSRNALLFGSLALIFALVILSVVGRYRAVFRAVLLVGAVLVSISALVLWDRLYPILESFFSDNGRFELWRSGFDNFLKSPIFGRGFYGISFTEESFFTAGFLPTMAHNTVIQLLGAMGIVGLVCYAYYRYASVIPFVKNPTVEKSMMGISILVLLLESLLDNFVFYFIPVLQYTVTLATVFAIHGRESSSPSSDNGDAAEHSDIDEPRCAL